MGRIKSTMVKKAAKQLLAEEHKFTKEFEHNKQLLRGLMPSKPLQNKIAGYIARLLVMKSKPVRTRKVEVEKEFKPRYRPQY